MHVKLHFNGLHQSGKDSAAPFASFLALHNRQAKDKVSLSLANLLYGHSLTRSRHLVSGTSRDRPCAGFWTIMTIRRSLRRRVLLAGIVPLPMLINRVRDLDEPGTVFDQFEQLRRRKEFDAVRRAVFEPRHFWSQFFTFNFRV